MWVAFLENVACREIKWWILLHLQSPIFIICYRAVFRALIEKKFSCWYVGRTAPIYVKYCISFALSEWNHEVLMHHMKKVFMVTHTVMSKCFELWWLLFLYAIWYNPTNHQFSLITQLVFHITFWLCHQVPHRNIIRLFVEKLLK